MQSKRIEVIRSSDAVDSNTERQRFRLDYEGVNKEATTHNLTNFRDGHIVWWRWRWRWLILARQRWRRWNRMHIHIAIFGAAIRWYPCREAQCFRPLRQTANHLARFVWFVSWRTVLCFQLRFGEVPKQLLCDNDGNAVFIVFNWCAIDVWTFLRMSRTMMINAINHNSHACTYFMFNFRSNGALIQSFRCQINLWAFFNACIDWRWNKFALVFHLFGLFEWRRNSSSDCSLGWLSKFTVHQRSNGATNEIRLLTSNVCNWLASLYSAGDVVAAHWALSERVCWKRFCGAHSPLHIFSQCVCECTNKTHMHSTEYAYAWPNSFGSARRLAGINIISASIGYVSLYVLFGRNYRTVIIIWHMFIVWLIWKI